MIALDEIAREEKRLNALKRYEILDTPPDGSFDHITSLAASIFKVPISIISLVDADRIWFKSHHGLSVNQIGRDPGLCASAILGTDAYIIENAIDDPRCLTNPLVAGEMGLRFYAAVPLQTEDNYNLGTLNIIDQKPRKFTDEDRVLLTKLGKIVMDEMNLRLAVRETATKIRNLSSDIVLQLKNAVRKIEADQSGNPKAITAYLDSSRIYLENLQNQLQKL